MTTEDQDKWLARVDTRHERADEVWKSCECCGAVLYDGDDDAGWAITGDERHVCPQCKPGLVHDAAQPPENRSEG